MFTVTDVYGQKDKAFKKESDAILHAVKLSIQLKQTVYVWDEFGSAVSISAKGKIGY